MFISDVITATSISKDEEVMETGGESKGIYFDKIPYFAAVVVVVFLKIKW